MDGFIKPFGVCECFLAITLGVFELGVEDICERVEHLLGVLGEDSCNELSSRDRDGRLLLGLVLDL